MNYLCSYWIAFTIRCIDKSDFYLFSPWYTSLDLSMINSAWKEEGGLDAKLGYLCPD